MLNRGFLNPEILNEVLQTGERGEVDFRLTPVSMLDAFSSGITCALKTGLLVWLIRDAMSVSRMTKKSISPH